MSSGNNIEQAIREAITYATTELGYTLVHSDWGNKEAKCLCPMGCLLLKAGSDMPDQPGMKDSQLEAANLLNVSEHWVSSFICGYDNAGFSSLKIIDPEAKELGQKIFNDYDPYDGYLFMLRREATS